MQQVVEYLETIVFESNNEVNSNACMENKIELLQEINSQSIIVSMGCMHISNSTNGNMFSHNFQLYLSDSMHTIINPQNSNMQPMTISQTVQVIQDYQAHNFLQLLTSLNVF